MNGNIHPTVRPLDSDPVDDIQEVVFWTENGCSNTSTRHSFPQVITTSAAQALVDVLAKAGATIPSRDAVDVRVIDDVEGSKGSIIDSESEVGGFPTIASGTAYTDSNNNGMSDEFEERLLVSDSNGLQISDSRGEGETYSNLEWFLMELAGDVALGGMATQTDTHQVIMT